MSLSIDILQTGDTARPELKRIAAELEPDALHRSAGPACLSLTKRHLLANPHNKRGWPTTNFYPRAARATSLQRSDAGPVISIAQIGMRQRYLGGPIAPVNARALTIPLCAEAYGKLASDFPDAFKITTAKGAFLAIRAGKGSAVKFLFQLFTGTIHQPADPSILPTDQEYADTAIDAISKKIGGDQK